jgi:VCBS repeat-containing protein
LVASYTGADVIPLLSANQSPFSFNGYVEFSGLPSFDRVVLGSGANAFEIENVSAGSVPAPHVQLSGPISGTLSVNDVDIGDSLTASVTGNAVIRYNGSAQLPANTDITALISASTLTFDTAESDGGTEILHWTYDPINPNLDFMRSGDTLTITFTAQVNDGHVTVGDQLLTITIVGGDSSAFPSNPEGTSGNVAATITSAVTEDDTLASEQSLALQDVQALAVTENTFVFDQTPALESARTMTIDDGFMIPRTGAIGGTIVQDPAGDGSYLQLIEQAMTLVGGGGIVRSGNDAAGSMPGFDGSDTIHLAGVDLDAGRINCTKTADRASGSLAIADEMQTAWLSHVLSCVVDNFSIVTGLEKGTTIPHVAFDLVV